MYHWWLAASISRNFCLAFFFFSSRFLCFRLAVNIASDSVANSSWPKIGLSLKNYRQNRQSDKFSKKFPIFSFSRQKWLKIGKRLAKFSQNRQKFGCFFQNFYRQKIGSRFPPNLYRLQGSEKRPFADKSAELVTLISQ